MYCYRILLFARCDCILFNSCVQDAQVECVAAYIDMNRYLQLTSADTFPTAFYCRSAVSIAHELQTI